MSEPKLFKFHVVRTPTGDRPYVSINRPDSYIAHLDASGDKAEVHEVEVYLPETVGVPFIGYGGPAEVSKVTRVR